MRCGNRQGMLSTDVGVVLPGRSELPNSQVSVSPGAGSTWSITREGSLRNGRSGCISAVPVPGVMDTQSSD